eukprot:9169371-Prorocentrum_lima.AAC.1
MMLQQWCAVAGWGCPCTSVLCTIHVCLLGHDWHEDVGGVVSDPCAWCNEGGQRSRHHSRPPGGVGGH